ncbi:MAG: hypothetical protein LBN23_06185, partial [Paludibacter sp.]|nr:hypothetical protein [Paludibacter sp.]
YDTEECSEDYYNKHCSSAKTLIPQYGEIILECKKCGYFTLRNKNRNSSGSSSSSSSSGQKHYRNGTAGQVCSGCRWREGEYCKNIDSQYNGYLPYSQQISCAKYTYR